MGSALIYCVGSFGVCVVAQGDKRTMTSQSIASTEVGSFSFEAFIRGYHAYKEQWVPWIGEVLPLERDPTNPENSNAFAVKNGSGTVGHVPFNLVPVVSTFLKRSVNKGMAEVTGIIKLSWCWLWFGDSMQVPFLWICFVHRATKEYCG